MKQAIAGVAPPELGEVTVMTVWPSVACSGPGRFLGRLMAISAGFWIFTVGRFMTLLAMPVGPLLYFSIRLPFNVQRYRLTNRRVGIMAGINPQFTRFVDLDRFDKIEIAVLPGQEWYNAGDLVFRRGDVETFRLAGVSRPEAFRQTCLKARMSYVGVRKALAMQTA
ncbi:MAG TPA: PH domain-containing protein [Pirellulales bacterium]|jgi:hypothetical protein|nr:PH domain-containing protein [Pirellulales bacterium]